MSKIEFLTTDKGSKEYKYKKHIWDLQNQLSINKFLGANPDLEFVKAGRIVEALEKTSGYKIEVDEEWKDKKFILYFIVVHGKILKGGKSKNPLPTRTYGAGTEINWTMKGSPSTTNYVYSQIFRKCLKDGVDVEFYCYECPSITNIYEFAGKSITIEVSPYEEMESILNGMLVEQNGKPIGEGNLLQQWKS